MIQILTKMSKINIGNNRLKKLNIDIIINQKEWNLNICKKLIKMYTELDDDFVGMSVKKKRNNMLNILYSIIQVNESIDMILDIIDNELII